MAPVIEGRRWLENRSRFLHAELERCDDPSRRRELEAEIERVDEELARHTRRRRRWWIFGGPPAS